MNIVYESESSENNFGVIGELENSLCHYRTKGSKNGIRLYQNKDGSLTPLGRIHYGVGDGRVGTKERRSVLKTLFSRKHQSHADTSSEDDDTYSKNISEYGLNKNDPINEKVAEVMSDSKVESEMDKLRKSYQEEKEFQEASVEEWRHCAAMAVEKYRASQAPAWGEKLPTNSELKQRIRSLEDKYNREGFTKRDLCRELIEGSTDIFIEYLAEKGLDYNKRADQQYAQTKKVVAVAEKVAKDKYGTGDPIPGMFRSVYPTYEVVTDYISFVSIYHMLDGEGLTEKLKDA